MRQFKTLFFAIVTAGVLMLTGCGSDNSKTEEGMQQISALQYANALALFDEAENDGENARLIARGRGIAYLGQADYESAVNCFLNALSLSNGFIQDIDYDINYYLADGYIGLKDYESAEEVYTSILALKESADCYYLRGNARLLQNDYAGALDDYNHAVSLSPKDTDLVIKIYESLDAGGYHDYGISFLDDALAGYEKNMSAVNKGKIYYYKGEYQTAAVTLEEARSSDNNDSEASVYLGMTYEAVGEYNYASNVYESYLARNPGDATALNRLALCRMKLGNYEGALESIEEGIATGDKGLLRALSYNEIVVYEYLGDFEKAQTLMTDYLEIYPDDEDAQREEIFLSTR